MMQEEIKKLIKKGEDMAVEFKESRKSANKDIYETVCAFLNRNGGHILLGVSDSGKIKGVDLDFVDKIKKEIVTCANNPHKINPPVYLVIEEVKIDNKTIIVIYVPESSQVHRCTDRIYDRSEDGDLDITHQTDAVANLYMRKQSSFSENKVYPYMEISDFRPDLFQKMKELISIRNNVHPWLKVNDKEFLKSARLYQKDLQTGKEGYTLAAMLLFGKDSTIQTALTYYRTDAILRRVNLDRYDDRDTIETNLIESYERLMNFIAKHLYDPFYLEGDIRIPLRSKIFREIISNTLIHREYLNPYPARLIIEKDKVVVENANRAFGSGAINPFQFSPHPKNPIIARIFREIGRADELGSGMRNIFKYAGVYSNGGKPELIEGDIFKTIIPLNPKITAQDTIEVTEKVTVKVTEKVTVKLTDNQKKIIRLMGKDSNITAEILSKKVGISVRKIRENTAKLKQKNLIKRVGSDKDGWWEVMPLKHQSRTPLKR